MKRNSALIALAFAIAVLVPGALASAQDLHKQYSLGAGGHILIQNISGDLKITGYAGNTVVVDAVRVGRDSELVKVEDLSSANRIELRVQYPESGNCNASVNFEVRVPNMVDYNFDRIGSVSGSIEVSGVRGNLSAQSVSGSVLVTGFAGLVSASSVSGKVEADITRLEGTGDMKFSSVSGSVSVRAPGNANLDIEMSTLSGALDTDFPIQVEEPKYGPGRSAHGRVGIGGNSLRLNSISGRVSLFRN